jgi:hypothetical protein
MKKAKPGELLIVEARRPRNILHHRKLFALLNLVVDNTDRYPDVETLLFALKIATGHCEVFPRRGRQARVHQAEVDQLRVAFAGRIRAAV